MDKKEGARFCPTPKKLIRNADYILLGVVMLLMETLTLSVSKRSCQRP